MYGEDATLSSLFLIVWLPRMIFGYGGYRHDLVTWLVFSYILGTLHLLLDYVVALTPVVLLIFIIALRLAFQHLRSDDGSFAPHQLESGRRHPFKPLILPCQTSHVRLFPEKHSFTYSYLQVGVPVGWSGCVASMVATDLERRSGKQRFPWSGLFRVDAADHLHRSAESLDLRAKLDIYIIGQVGCLPPFPLSGLMRPRETTLTSIRSRFW